MILRLNEKAKKKMSEAFQALREIGFDFSDVRIDIDNKELLEVGFPFPTTFIQNTIGRVEFRIPDEFLEREEK